MRKIALLVFVACCLCLAKANAQEARLMRFPAVHGNRVVFTYAGDLYTVPLQGGVARKLTNHVGFEMFARFSPDGKTIAFTGQYDGNTEVFAIPSEGGVPKRLTHTATLNRDDVADRMGPNNIVMAWTPDGKSVVYRSRKQTFNDFVGALFKVSADGGMSEELPLSGGGFCSFSADGKVLAFNRVFREFRTWKYYQGGMADDIWIFDFDSKEVKNITNNAAQDLFPMWIGDEIFFASDRERTMNLFAYHTKTGAVQQVTRFTEYDIKFPSHSGSAIVFENGGHLYHFDATTKTSTRIPVTIYDDFEYSRPEYKDVSRSTASVGLSPNGERLVLSARGDVYTVPTEKGITRNLTQSSDAHDRAAQWSPDGKYIAYLSDRSGEYEIYIQAQDGSAGPVKVTNGINSYIFGLAWSPDSRKILFNDRLNRLMYVDIDTKKVTEVARNEFGQIFSFSWSPDSRWVAYSTQDTNRFSVIYLYSVETGQKRPVTDSWYSSSQPSFSSDGKYLLFTSGRDFSPIYSQTEWNHAYRNMSKVYMALLSKDTPSPFTPENGEVASEPPTPEKQVNAPKTAKSKDEPKKDAAPAVTVKVDFEGILSRIIALPVEAASYGNIYCTDGKVYYSYFNAGEGRRGSIAKMYDLKKQSEVVLGESMGFSLSPNGKKMLVVKNRSYSVIDLPSSAVKFDKTVDLSGMRTWVDYRKEWKQIYDESWRQMRDFFYVENMHGVDWTAMHAKYAALLPHVNHRNDLTYLIGELIGELNVGHAYVNSGERPEPSRIKLGLLGAKISRHPGGYFRVDRIIEGKNWDTSVRSPLQAVGVNVKAGDFILAVDGQSLQGVTDIYSTLVGKANKTVELVVNTKPDMGGSRKVLVTPIADEASLYYYDWVQNNIRKVAAATGGEVGYIHIPDMGVEGLNEFVKHFYPQLTKKGLIIDDRGNGGGNVSPMILERLNREVYRLNARRGVAHYSTIPAQTHYGPKVLLLDRYSASDGDLFPYGFKRLGIGTTIGTRSWGGVVGISGSLPFIDGGDLRKPEFASYSSESSSWIIEGYGVDPDIYLDNDPYREYMGIDDQLNKAIEVVKEQMKNVKPLPGIPQSPDKSK